MNRYVCLMARFSLNYITMRMDDTHFITCEITLVFLKKSKQNAFTSRRARPVWSILLDDLLPLGRIMRHVNVELSYDDSKSD